MPMVLMMINGSRMSCEPEDINLIVEFPEVPPSETGMGAKAHSGLYIGPVPIKIAMTFDQFHQAILNYMEERELSEAPEEGNELTVTGDIIDRDEHKELDHVLDKVVKATTPHDSRYGDNQDSFEVMQEKARRAAKKN
jgi:hypothetical protein